MAAYESLDGLVEVIDTSTQKVQRVPADWLDNPRTGRFFEKTLAQLALEHELPVPPADLKVAELRDYAAAAGVEVADDAKKADILAALEPYLAVHEDEQDEEQNPDGDVPPVDPTTPAAGDNTPLLRS